MGYDLYWVNDPYAKARRAVAFAAADALLTDPEFAHQARFDVQCAVGGYFRTSQSMMGSLISEMETQGMFEGNESMREKLARQEGEITPDEISRALEHVTWPISPAEAAPPVVVSRLDRVMAAASLQSGGSMQVSGGAEAMMQIHPVAWALKWVTWVQFLFQGETAGGIVVS